MLLKQLLGAKESCCPCSVEDLIILTNDYAIKLLSFNIILLKLYLTILKYYLFILIMSFAADHQFWQQRVDREVNQRNK